MKGWTKPAELTGLHGFDSFSGQSRGKKKGVSMSEHGERHGEYVRPALTEYGTIEEWTKADCTSLVCVSIVFG